MADKTLIVGNWKMNPSTALEAKRIAQKVKRAAADLSRTEVVICPPLLFSNIMRFRKESPHFHLGAQSVSYEEGNAHTGEVSAMMLKEAGVEYVITGHSEMREAGETDLMVSKRVRAILEADLMPIVCIGEKARDESGSHFDFIREQMKDSLADVPKSRSSEIIMAYEPIWAIGAKDPMPPSDIHEMTIFVRKVFADIFGIEYAKRVSVLYGGAVNCRNAAEIMKTGQVDGLLVGRESVNVSGFVELIRAVDAVS